MDPAAEWPAVALALDAVMVAASVRGRREIAADDFMLGPQTTALEPDELLVEVVVPVGDEGVRLRGGDPEEWVTSRWSERPVRPARWPSLAPAPGPSG